MGVLDALTILGSGIGRGYRGSQELQRQMAEERRKALLDEREQIVKEQQARSQQALNDAQIKEFAMQTAMEKFGLGEKQKAAARAGTSVVPGGGPLKLKLLGQDVNLPGDVESLTTHPDLIKELATQAFQAAHPGFYMNYPPAGTAAAQIRNTPEARGRDYITRILSGELSPLLGESADEYAQRTNAVMRAKLNFLNEQDPEALKALFGGGESDIDTTTTDSGALDQPALAPKKRGTHKLPPYKGNNRFSGVKVVPQVP